MKNNEYSTFDLLKYTCICTVGPSILFGIVDLQEYTNNNPFLINLVMGLTFLMVLFFSLCYAELKEIFPEEGGDFVYIERFYNENAGILYSLSTLFISGPACNVVHLKELVKTYQLENYSKYIFYIVMTLVASPLFLLSDKIKNRLINYLGLIHQLFILFVFISLPCAYFIENPLIRNDEIYERGKITVKTFFHALSVGFFFYSGFNEANSLHRKQTGPLYKVYIISTTALFIIYSCFFNMFLLLYKNDSGEINYKNVLGFLGSSHEVVYKIISTILYSIPLFSLSFMISHNINYLCRKFKLKYFHRIVYLIILMGITFGLTFFEFETVFNVISAFMILFSLLSVSGILKHKYKNKKYHMKISLTVVVTSIIFLLLMLSLSIYYMIVSFINV